jgi:hypothetical protein
MEKNATELSLSNAQIPGDRAYAYQFHEQTELVKMWIQIPEHLSLPDLPKQSFISQRSQERRIQEPILAIPVLRFPDVWHQDAIFSPGCGAAYLASLTLWDDAEAVLVDAQISVLERPAVRPARNPKVDEPQ